MNLLRQLAIVVAGLLWVSCACLAMPHLSIPQLVKESSLIVVADVGQIKPVGRTEVVFNGVVLPGHKYRTGAETLYILMGQSAGRIRIEFSLPDAGNTYRSIRPGVRMLFLKSSAATYQPADLYYPDLPAVASPPPDLQGKSVTEQVFAELGAVVASPDASATDRRDVLLWSYAIPSDNKLFLRDLVIGARNSPDPSVHWWIEAELINRNNLSQFSDVCDALLSNDVPPEQQRMVLYAIGWQLTNPDALPQLNKLLRSPEPKIRAASVGAMWHIASPSSLDSLARSLHDPDSEVRYYAIRALDQITGQPGWGPGPAEYEEHGSKYLRHWLDWAQENLAQPRK